MAGLANYLHIPSIKLTSEAYAKEAPTSETHYVTLVAPKKVAPKKVEPIASPADSVHPVEQPATQETIKQPRVKEVIKKPTEPKQTVVSKQPAMMPVAAIKPLAKNNSQAPLPPTNETPKQPIEKEPLQSQEPVKHAAQTNTPDVATEDSTPPELPPQPQGNNTDVLLANNTAPPVEQPTSADTLADSATDTQEQFNAYLAMIRAQIEQHKFFPVAARRRGIEGNVQVSFGVSDKGEVREVTLAGAHRLLTHAVKRALEQASPFTPPPPSVTQPINLTYTISFNLQ